MSLVLQVSDPHFGTERAAVAQALLRLARAQAPDVLLLSGDITQRARRAQYAAARAFVERLGVPRVLAIPGNHDIPLFDLAGRLLAPYREHVRAFGPELEPEHVSADLLLLALNTTRPWRHKDGEVSPAQVERVARRLERADPRQLRIVAVHQPVAVTHPEDRANLLHGHEAAVRRWAAAGCDLIVGGHIHLPYVLPLSARFLDLPREVWAVQAGTALSWRLRHEADNSVNLIRTLPAPGGPTPRACMIERWDYVESARAFARVARDELRLGAERPAASIAHPPPPAP
jgi:predicted phosphodiesterase